MASPSFAPASPRSPQADAVSAIDRARFRSLVQSPLRAALLRFLHAQPDAIRSITELVQALARIRTDVENCMSQIVTQGYARRAPGPEPAFSACWPADPHLRRLLEEFLAEPPRATAEDDSTALRRFRELIGIDEKMLLVLESIRTVAKTDISVLILGPTGVGKEVAARVIHELSRRRGNTFQAVSCAALPDSLFESEVFGYEKGAFTGAAERKPGRMELADRGTLFLDEIGDLSLVAQAKLLRALEERRVERLGSRQAFDVDFRLVSATNRPLDVFVEENRFREDLYYRINAFTIRLPSLRERPVDIPILAGRFLAAYCAEQGLESDAKVFSTGALSLLQQYGWPGNIREMIATVSRAALSSRGRVIQPADVHFLRPQRTNDLAGAGRRIVPLHEVERAHIQSVLESVHWNKKLASRLLEISRETLYRKIRCYGLAPGSRTDNRAAAPAEEQSGRFSR
ncbi:MAG: sigma-54 interaction domain-containing protein [Vicinamibacterales bacterium]